MTFLRTLLLFIFVFSSIEVTSQVNLSPAGTDPVKVYMPDRNYDKFNLFGNRNSVTKTKYKLSNLMDNEICNTAVTAGEWDKSRSEYIKEAKERGLNCGVSEIRSINSNNAVSLNVNANKSISNYSDYVICLRSQWKEDYDKYLQEAKNRGLDCGVKKVKKFVASKPGNTIPTISSAELEKEKHPVNC